MIILSGGQTGVDRAALDAALAAGVLCGGWCPEGRLAEGERIPERYPLVELPGARNLERTRQNVLDSDGTLIIFYGSPQGGTARTLEFCRMFGKPHLLIDAGALEVSEALPRLLEFVAANRIERLNVAGPRASGEPRAYGYAYELVAALLARRAADSVS